MKPGWAATFLESWERGEEMDWRRVGIGLHRGVPGACAGQIPDLSAGRADVYAARHGNAAGNDDARRDAAGNVHAAPNGDVHGHAAPDAEHANGNADAAARDLSSGYDARMVRADGDA